MNMQIEVSMDGEMYRAEITWPSGDVFAITEDFYREQAVSRAAYIVEKVFAYNKDDIKEIIIDKEAA
jgi:hypothetical protein